jgi:hypothetical protein
MFTCVRWNTRAHVWWIQMCFILLCKNALILCLSHSAAAGAIKLFCFIHMTLTGWFRHESTKHMSSKFRNLLLVLKIKYYSLSEKTLQPSVLALSSLQSHIDLATVANREENWSHSIQVARLTMYWALWPESSQFRYMKATSFLESLLQCHLQYGKLIMCQ